MLLGYEIISAMLNPVLMTETDYNSMTMMELLYKQIIFAENQLRILNLPRCLPYAGTIFDNTI